MARARNGASTGGARPRSREALVRALCRLQAADARRLVASAGTLADDQAVALLAARFDALVRARPRRAVGAARGLAVLAAAVRSPLARARAHRAAGVAAHLDGRAAAAREGLTEAARAFGRMRRPLDEGDAWRALVEVLHPVDPRAALSAHARATRCYARAGALDARREGSLALNLGNVFHRLDRHQDALAAYDAARGHFVRGGLPAQVAQADYSRANILVTLDRTAEARRLYAGARERFREAGRTAQVALCDYALAGLELREGDLDRALARLDDVRARFASIGQKAWTAHADLDTADALVRANRAGDAALAARRAETAFRRAGHDGARANALATLGAAALAEGRPRRAIPYFRRAAQAQRDAGNAIAAALADVGTATARTRAGDPEGGLAHARRAASQLGRAGLRSHQARALAVASEAALALSRTRAARTAAAQAVALARGARDARVELAALLAAARAARHAVSTDAEWALLRDAERVVERLRAGVTTEPSRLAFALDKGEVYEALVDNRLRAGDVRAALSCAEKGKARLLAERLAQARIAGAPGRTPRARHLCERLAELDRQLAVAEARRAEDDRAPRGLRRSDPARTGDLAGVRARALAELSRIDPPTATFAGLRLPDPLAALDTLAPGEIVLLYTIARGALHLFVIEPAATGGRDAARIEVHADLAPLDAVADRAARLRFHLGKGVLGDEHHARFGAFVEHACRAYLAELHDMLIAPVSARLDGRSVRIVPHGPLHGLPFHAFEANGVPLVERCVISYAPSLSVLALAGGADGTAGAAGWDALVLGVADERAPAIAAEVDAVCRAIPSARVFRGEAAGREALALCEERPKVMHIASHGWFAEGQALAGALKLGDAWVALGDIYTLRATAELVVLSGCDTGRGTVHSGDEWVGLVRGFLQAGARGVVGALWEVHDRSASPLIAAFYRALAAGTPVATALARAQREARRVDSSPLRWAPFAVVGDPGWRLHGTAEAVEPCA